MEIKLHVAGVAYRSERGIAVNEALQGGNNGGKQVRDRTKVELHTFGFWRRNG